MLAIMIYKIYIGLELSFKNRGEGMIHTVATNLMAIPEDETYTLGATKESSGKNSRITSSVDRKNDNNIEKTFPIVESLNAEKNNIIRPKRKSIMRKSSILIGGVKQTFNSPDEYLKRKIYMNTARYSILFLIYKIIILLFSIYVSFSNINEDIYMYNYNAWCKSCPKTYFPIIINIFSMVLVNIICAKLNKLIKLSSIFIEIRQFNMFLKYIFWIYPVTNVSYYIIKL